MRFLAAAVAAVFFDIVFRLVIDFVDFELFVDFFTFIFEAKVRLDQSVHIFLLSL
jgi:hypothetical protein